MTKKGSGRPKVSQAERGAIERTRSFWTRFSSILQEEQDLRAPFPIVALAMVMSAFIREQDYNGVEARLNVLLARGVK